MAEVGQQFYPAMEDEEEEEGPVVPTSAHARSAGRGRARRWGETGGTFGDRRQTRGEGGARAVSM